MNSQESPQSATSDEYAEADDIAHKCNDTVTENETSLNVNSVHVFKNRVETSSFPGTRAESQIIIPVSDEEAFVTLFPLGRTKPTIRMKLRKMNLDKMLKFKQHQLLEKIFNHIVSFGLRDERSNKYYLKTKSMRTATQTLNSASRALLWMFRTKNEEIQYINSVSDICLPSLSKSINDFYFIHLKLYKRGSVVNFLRHIIDFLLLIPEIDPLSTNIPQWREQEMIIIQRLKHLTVRADKLNCSFDSMVRFNRYVPEYKELVDSFGSLKKWLTEQLETNRQSILSDPVLFKQIGVAINLFIILENGQRAETIVKLRYEDYLRIRKVPFNGKTKHLLPYPLNKTGRSNHTLVLSEELADLLSIYVELRSEIVTKNGVRPAMLFVNFDGKVITNSLRVLKNIMRMRLHDNLFDGFTMVIVRNSVANITAGKLLDVNRDILTCCIAQLMNHQSKTLLKNYVTNPMYPEIVAHTYLESVANGQKEVSLPQRF